MGRDGLLLLPMSWYSSDGLWQLAATCTEDPCDPLIGWLENRLKGRCWAFILVPLQSLSPVLSRGEDGEIRSGRCCTCAMDALLPWWGLPAVEPDCLLAADGNKLSRVAAGPGCCRACKRSLASCNACSWWWICSWARLFVVPCPLVPVSISEELHELSRSQTLFLPEDVLRLRPVCFFSLARCIDAFCRAQSLLRQPWYAMNSGETLAGTLSGSGYGKSSNSVTTGFFEGRLILKAEEKGHCLWVYVFCSWSILLHYVHRNNTILKVWGNMTGSY